MKLALVIQGMHGLGDNLHQRAVLRQLMQRYTITLETSWPSVYHDLVGDGLKLVRRPVALRTQTKNAARESHLFAPQSAAVPGSQRMRISYGGRQIVRSKSGTIMEVMCDVTETDFSRADFRLPVPQIWFDELTRIMSAHMGFPSTKPLLVYRPLTVRPEWRGGVARNANPVDYSALIAAIRDEFYVVSVADLDPGREWIVGPELIPDVALHHGELTFETMAALFAQADLVFTSSGFAAILGPAVETPTVSVVGGYESTGCHADGARYAPMLNIGPRVECSCWTSACPQRCDKAIDLDAALPRLKKFVSEVCIQIRDKDWSRPTRSTQEMFSTDEPAMAGPPGTRIGAAPHRSSTDYLTYLTQTRARARDGSQGQKA